MASKQAETSIGMKQINIRTMEEEAFEPMTLAVRHTGPVSTLLIPDGRGLDVPTVPLFEVRRINRRALEFTLGKGTSAEKTMLVREAGIAALRDVFSSPLAFVDRRGVAHGSIALREPSAGNVVKLADPTVTETNVPRAPAPAALPAPASEPKPSKPKAPATKAEPEKKQPTVGEVAATITKKTGIPTAPKPETKKPAKPGIGRTVAKESKPKAKKASKPKAERKPSTGGRGRGVSDEEAIKRIAPYKKADKSITGTYYALREAGKGMSWHRVNNLWKKA